MAKFTHVVHVNLNTSDEQRYADKDTDNEIYFDMNMIYLHIRVEIQNIPVLDNIFVPVHFAEIDRCFSILKNVLI